MGKTVRYYYDPESCTYREVKLTRNEVLKNVGIVIGVSSVLTAIVISLIIYVFDDPRSQILRQENADLRDKIEQYDERATVLLATVEKLKERDSDLYRSILQKEPIADGEWNGGIGGDVALSIANTPESVRETERKFEQLMSRVKTLNDGYDEVIQHFKENEERLRHLPAMRPVAGSCISGFGPRRHPIYKVTRMHKGIDFVARTGTPVYTTGDGKVKFAGVKGNGFGRYVDVDHGYGYVTRYAHLSKTLVKAGDKVKRGDLVGKSGNTGLSKGPHLHYEILRNGGQINPIDYFCDLTPSEFNDLRKQVSSEDEETFSMD